MDLSINSSLIIPSKELKWRFSRSSGSGGQGVNTTDSRVELIFNINSSSVIDSFQKKRLLESLENRILNSCLTIVVADERSQYQNRKLALERMAALLEEGLKPPPPQRLATKASRASKKRRLTSKRHRSALKKQRQKGALTEY
tara:strand:+ start:553 stop:981 length:429 start_codon:yes stop_codon:yes gene_type:complete